MTTAKWLDEVLAAGATLNLHHPDGRAQLAERILAALPAADIVTAIAGSARAVLEQKGLAIDGGVRFAGVGTYSLDALVKEIGRNGAQSVLCVVEDPLGPVDANLHASGIKLRADRLEERLHQLLDAALAFGAELSVFERDYPGDLRAHIERWAARNPVRQDERPRTNATHLATETGHLVLVAYWRDDRAVDLAEDQIAASIAATNQERA